MVTIQCAKKVFGSSILVGAVALLQAGCALSEKSLIPGDKSNAANPKGMELSTVLTALKYQVALGLNDVVDLKEKYAKNHPIQKWNFQQGTGKITATVLTTKTDAGNIEAVIPFSGFDGSLLTPNLGGRWSANGTHIDEFSFKIDPNLEEDIEIQRPAILNNISISDDIRDAIMAKYISMLQVADNYKDNQFGVGLAAQTLSLTFTFAVVQSTNGRLDIRFIPTSPTFDRTGSALSSEWNKTVSSQLTLTLPFDLGLATDSRRLFYAVKGTNNTLFVEEPFSEKRYNTLKNNAATGQGNEPDASTKFRGFSLDGKEVEIWMPGQPKSNLAPEPEPPPF